MVLTDNQQCYLPTGDVLTTSWTEVGKGTSYFDKVNSGGIGIGCGGSIDTTKYVYTSTNAAPFEMDFANNRIDDEDYIETISPWVVARSSGSSGNLTMKVTLNIAATTPNASFTISNTSFGSGLDAGQNGDFDGVDYTAAELNAMTLDIERTWLGKGTPETLYVAGVTLVMYYRKGRVISTGGRIQAAGGEGYHKVLCGG